MKTKNLTRQNGSIKLDGWLHSNKENGKFTKVQKRFIKLEENGRFFYLGKKRFIKPFYKYVSRPSCGYQPKQK